METMTKNDLHGLIKKEIASQLVENKKFFEVRNSSEERCRKYIKEQTDKETPGFTDLMDFEMEAVFYSAIEESVKITLDVLSSCGVLRVDD